MFDSQGRASPGQHGRWRAKGALVPLQADAILIAAGEATNYYRTAWRAAFPDRRPLPSEAIATPAGLFTQAMLDVWL